MLLVERPLEPGRATGLFPVDASSFLQENAAVTHRDLRFVERSLSLVFILVRPSLAFLRSMLGSYTGTASFAGVASTSFFWRTEWATTIPVSRVVVQGVCRAEPRVFLHPLSLEQRTNGPLPLCSSAAFPRETAYRTNAIVTTSQEWGARRHMKRF